MKTMTVAATTLALSGVLFLSQDVALAKGPLELGVQSPLVLVKETPTEIDMKDFPFGLEEGVSKNVRMSFEQVVEIPEEDESVTVSYVVTLPTLEVEKDGDNEVTITFPDEYTLAMILNLDGDDVQMDMEGTADNQVMTFIRDGDRMSYAGSADAYTLSITSPQAAEEGVDFLFTMGGKDLDIKGAGAAEQDWTDMKSLDVSYDYTMGAINFEAKAAGDGPDEEFEMIGETGSITANGLIGQGRIEGASEMNDLDVTIIKPMPIEVSVGKLTTEVGVPTDPSPKPQAVKYLLGAEDIVLDDFIWSMMDPNGAFPRDLKRVWIDVEMQAMLMVSLLDPASIAEAEESGMPPMLPVSASIKSIEFDGLGLQVNATGEGKLKGTQPEGEAYVTVKGLSDFVASGREAGMFGEQESMMIEGMAGQLGKEGDDGELIFDINTDGGMVNINGAPIMPVPGMQ